MPDGIESKRMDAGGIPLLKEAVEEGYSVSPQTMGEVFDHIDALEAEIADLQSVCVDKGIQLTIDGLVKREPEPVGELCDRCHNLIPYEKETHVKHLEEVIDRFLKIESYRDVIVNLTKEWDAHTEEWVGRPCLCKFCQKYGKFNDKR